MSLNENPNIKQLKCALSLPCVPDICQAINSTLDLKYTYLVAPLINPNFKREHITRGLKHQSLPLTRSDLLLNTDCTYYYEFIMLFQQIYILIFDLIFKKSLAKLHSWKSMEILQLRFRR